MPPSEAKASLKRVRFFFFSFSSAVLLLAASFLPENIKFFYLLGVFLATIIAVPTVLELRIRNPFTFYVLILPLHLVLGAGLSFFEFPNLSLLLKLILASAIFTLYYALLLTLNIYSVVWEKGRVIPLFRVANTWSQILVVIISIPYYSVVFKLSVHPAVQVGIVALSSFLMAAFYIRMLELETGESSIWLSVLASFWVFLLSSAIAFLPFESFFRGLFLASVLLFGLAYAYNYLKHSLTSQIVLEYITITVAFLFIGMIFIP